MRREPINKFYFSTKGNSLHLFVYDPNTRKSYSKSVRVLFGKGNLHNEPGDFDNKSKQFPKKLIHSSEDNSTLQHWGNAINALLDTGCIESAEQLLHTLEALNNTPIVAQHKVTLFEHNETILEANTARKSSNKYAYAKLKNKLLKQQKTAIPGTKIFGTLPIESITTVDFIEFGDWCRAQKVDDYNSMKAFRHVVYDYHHRILKDHSFKFNHKVVRPVSKIKANGNDETLSPQQMKQLLSLNVNDIQLSAPSWNTYEKKRMLLDVALLMYYTFSRPYDVLLFRVEDYKPIFDNKDIFGYWSYAPHKKGDKATVCEIPIINVEALHIIDNHRGNRKKGYLFPYLDTETDKYVARNHVTMKINELLLNVAKLYNWKFKPTMYTLRHTRITEACTTGIPKSVVADIAQTSVKEINATYYDKKTAAKRGYEHYISNLQL